jgi:hypothetical protein
MSSLPGEEWQKNLVEFWFIALFLVQEMDRQGMLLSEVSLQMCF